MQGNRGDQRHYLSWVSRMVWMVICFMPLTAQESASVIPLEPDKPQEHMLGVGQAHNYKIHLQAGQYVRIEVEQRGINVLLNVFAPDDKYLFWHDQANDTKGTERIVIVADTLGDYRLWIAPQAPANAKNIPPGKYVVTITSVQTATEPERRKFQAQILSASARQRGYSSNEKEKTEGVNQAQEWLRLYRSDGDLDTILDMLRLLGANAISQRSFAQSADYHQQMIAIVQATGDHRRLGFILQDISFQYHSVREYQIAVTYKMQELAIWQRIGDRVLQGWAWNGLSNQYLRLRQIEKALDAHAQRLAILRELKDLALEADTLQNIANLYAWIDEPAKALEYVMQALRVAEAAGAKWIQASLLMELPDYIANKEGFIRTLEWMKKDPIRQQEFMTMYEKSRTLFHDLNDPFEAMPLATIALWQAQTGQREAALASVERVEQLRQSITNNDRRNAVKASIASVYAALGDFDKAIALREEAARDFNGDLGGSANLLVGLANVLSNAGRLVEARARLEEALRIKESLRARLSDQEQRTNVSTELAQTYCSYADLLMQIEVQNPTPSILEQAFIASERARARSLLDLLNEARANLRSDVDPALLQQENRLQQRLNSLTPRPNDARKEQLLEANKDALNTTLEALQKIRTQIRQASPRFAELTEPQPPSVREIQTSLLDEETMLLAYSLGEQHSYVWAITSEAIHGYQLPAPDVITKTTQRVYELLTVPQHLRGLTMAQQKKQLVAAERLYQTEAAVLSQMLLGPVASQLGRKRLLIVADGALQYLPFGALPKPKDEGRGQRDELDKNTGKGIGSTRGIRFHPSSLIPHPLIADHEIISLPSVSVMMLLRQELAQRKLAPKAVAVLADPVFDATDPRVKAHMLVTAPPAAANVPLSPLARSLRSFAGRDGLARLLLSRDEAEGIAATVPAAERLKALDFKASRAEAMSTELSQYRIVHFATHGLLNAERPELSGLVFSMVDEQGHPQDGFLQAHEIYTLKLPTELVVLSACQSGLGKDIKGEGMIGLTRGFMYAGAARVVASLWRVDDYATSVLMKKFYRSMLQEKLPAAAALRKAQIEMWQQKQWQSPFYWGAFVLQGEWR